MMVADSFRLEVGQQVNDRIFTVAMFMRGGSSKVRVDNGLTVDNMDMGEEVDTSKVPSENQQEENC